MTRRQTPMSAVDRSWLRMECPESPMMISAVLVFDQPIALKRLKRTLDERFLTFRRFRQRVVTEGDRTYWQDDPLFHIDNHIHVLALPGDGGKQELQTLTSDLTSTSLDFRRPLWQIHYIENYQGGCALLVRIHHCIADGISLVRVLLSLTDNSPEPRLSRVSTSSQSKAHAPQGLRQLASRALHNGQTAIDQAGLFLKSIRNEPGYPFKLATTAGNIAVDLLKLGLSPAEPDTCLKTPLSGRKHVAWADPVSYTHLTLPTKA